MKTESTSQRCHTLLLLAFLLAALLPLSLQAQTDPDDSPDAEGITVYSDTSGTASTVAYPQVDDTANASDTATYAARNTAYRFSVNDDSMFHPFRLLSGLFHNMVGFGLFLAIAVIILLVLLPLLLLVALIYLIIRLTRPTPRITRPGEVPPTPEEIRTQQKQQTIRLASIGVAMLLIEWYFGLGHIAGIVGIVLLCIAGGQWLSSKDKKTNN